MDQLGVAFSVRDVMVSLAELKRVDPEDEVEPFFKKYEDFDYAPFPSQGDEIKGYFKRGEGKKYFIKRHDLLSDGTSLLTLLDLLTDRDFFFVLSSNKICGFVHYSDLNNEITKLPLFILFASAESHLWRLIKAQITEALVEQVVDNKERLDAIKRKRREVYEGRADRGWDGLLYFSEVLRLAKKSELIDLKPEEYDLLPKIRNKVAHSDRPLVEKHRDVKELKKARQLCEDLLQADKISIVSG